MDPFVAALDALYHAPGSAAAVYRPGGSDPLPDPIRVIRSQGDDDVPYGRAAVVTRTDALSFRKADVPNPAAGDIIEVGPDHFTLIGEARTDVEGLEWTCEAEPVEP